MLTDKEMINKRAYQIYSCLKDNGIISFDFDDSMSFSSFLSLYYEEKNDLEFSELLDYIEQMRNSDIIDENNYTTSVSEIGEYVNKEDIPSSNEPNNNDLNSVVLQEFDDKGFYNVDYINDLINKGEDLYKRLDGDKIPKSNVALYYQFQIFRLIDSGASDLIIEPDKKDGKIWNRLKIKFGVGYSMIQDETEAISYLNYESESKDTGTKDVSKFSLENEDNDKNVFFNKLRRHIGNQSSGFNSDLITISQDGGFSVEYKGTHRDFRLNSFPSKLYKIFSPRYSIRMNTDGAKFKLGSFFLHFYTKQKYIDIVESKKLGITFVAGPVGSGKSSTSIAIINEFDKSKFDIMTIENPIEARLSGIQQSQVNIDPTNPKYRYGLKEGQKSVLRQFVDIFFIGEVRTAEDIEFSIESGLYAKTLTTIHAQTAIDCLNRLITNVPDRNLIGGATENTTGQRLINVVCPECSHDSVNKDKIISKIRGAYNLAKANFHKELIKSFGNMNGDDIGVEDIRAQLYEDLDFITNEDLDSIYDLLIDNEDKLLKLNLEGKKDFILNLFKDFPNPKCNQYNELLIKNIQEGWNDEYIEVLKGFGYSGDELKGIIELMKSAKIKDINHEGCPNCDGGLMKDRRICLTEILNVDENVSNFIQEEGFKLSKLRSYIMKRGFVNMRMDGYNSALLGLISYDDLIKIV